MDGIPCMWCGEGVDEYLAADSLHLKCREPFNDYLAEQAKDAEEAEDAYKQWELEREK